jgi:hypothetical protein
MISDKNKLNNQNSIEKFSSVKLKNLFVKLVIFTFSDCLISFFVKFSI